MSPDFDLILVGGGLANGLIAWRLAQVRPTLRLCLLERDARLGGNHTWSFHQSDLDALQHRWLEPLVAHRWADHEVIFPARRRRLGGAYATLTAERFHQCLAGRLGTALRLGSEVVDVAPQAVALADGTRLTAHAVLDGRGPATSPHLALGYQTFLGRELRLDRPHGLHRPVLMDASVAQHAGYRFVYLLPFAADRVLVEDTYYTDAGPLPLEQLRQRIDDYVVARGWSVAEVLREEQGVLPIVLAGDAEAFLASWQGVPRSGLAAGLFHATTGYSLPHAVRLADRIAALPRLDSAALLACTAATLRTEWRRQGFFRLLNRMLFLAARPDRRWRVMQRFYGLPEPLIARFYAARPTLADRMRILAGKPPVPLGAALRAALAGDLHRRKDLP